jgi:heme/copper-type cytochrome/quinol oxidase subunit 2
LRFPCAAAAYNFLHRDRRFRGSINDFIVVVVVVVIVIVVVVVVVVVVIVIVIVVVVVDFPLKNADRYSGNAERHLGNADRILALQNWHVPES